MKRLSVALLLVSALMACSALPSTGDGIVALEIQYTPPLVLKLGETLTLSARALNQQGDPVPAEIRWQTPDTLAISVDSVSGVVRALLGTGTGRIQARVGTLNSDLLSIALQP